MAHTRGTSEARVRGRERQRLRSRRRCIAHHLRPRHCASRTIVEPGWHQKGVERCVAHTEDGDTADKGEHHTLRALLKSLGHIERQCRSGAHDKDDATRLTGDIFGETLAAHLSDVPRANHFVCRQLAHPFSEIGTLACVPRRSIL